MSFAKRRVEERGTVYCTISVERNQPLDLEDASVDIIIVFILDTFTRYVYLDEFKRLLKPGGYFIGAIPAEGGLAWEGECSPRRWLKKIQYRSGQNYLPEHPNYADQILKSLIKCLNAKPFSTGRYLGCRCSSESSHSPFIQ